MPPRRIFPIASAIVGLSAWSAQHRDLLASSTREGGPFELGTAGLLLLAGVLAGRAAFIARRSRLLWGALAVLFVAAAGEELSWGQHLLGFEAGAFFETHNLQRERNLHNLIPAPVFNTVVYVSAYLFFVVLPSWVHLRGRARLESLPRWIWPLPLPGLDTTMVFTFASILHAYFLPITYSDTAFAWLAIGLAAARIARGAPERRRARAAHLLGITAVAVLCVAAHPMFAFQNMQYELREMVIALAVALWVLEATPPTVSPVGAKNP